MFRWGALKTQRWLYAVGGVCALAVVAEAQDTPPSGFQVDLDVAQGLSTSDNFDNNGARNSGYQSTTTIGLGVSTQTKHQRLSFRTGTTLELRTDGTNETTDPYTRFNYRLGNRNTEFSTSFNYSKGDVSSNYQDPFLPIGFLISDSGTRANTGLNLGLELGREAPIGAALRAYRNRTIYVGTTNPDLFNSDTIGGSVTLRFDIARNMTANLIASQSDRKTTGNGVNQDAQSLGVTLDYALNDTTAINAELSYDKIVLLGGPLLSPTDKTEDGISFGFGFSHDLANGDVTSSFSSDVGENGRRSLVSARRSFELTNATLGLSFGLSKTAGISGISPLYGVDYVQELPHGALNVSLSQSVGARSDNAEVLNTNFSLGYMYELNAMSSIDTTVAYRNNNILGATTGDTSFLDMSIAYHYDMTTDWDLVGSLTRTVSRSDTAATATTSNTIFVGLERQFNWFP